MGQKALQQSLGVNKITGAAENFHDAFGRAESGRFPVFPQIVAGFFNRFEADPTNVAEVRTALMDFSCFVPGSIDKDYLPDTGQVTWRFV